MISTKLTVSDAFLPLFFFPFEFVNFVTLKVKAQPRSKTIKTIFTVYRLFKLSPFQKGWIHLNTVLQIKRAI